MSPLLTGLRRRPGRGDLEEVPARAEVLQLASLLLTYPDDELLDARGEVVAAVAALPRSAASDCLSDFMDWFTMVSRPAAQKHYVEVFDLRRKSSLYLTYYLHGDTRKRGMALLTLKQRYRAAGLALGDEELPDFLPVVLEFAARGGVGTGEAPLRQHRQGVEVIRAALRDAGSPYARLLDAVSVVLGALTEAERVEVERLAQEGPPAEDVGLEPYGPMSVMGNGLVTALGEHGSVESDDREVRA